MANILIRALAALGFADVPPPDVDLRAEPSQAVEPLPPVESPPDVVVSKPMPDSAPATVRPVGGLPDAAVVSGPSNGADLRMVQATPTTMDDARLIAKALAHGRPVAMNLEDLEESMATRIVDFVRGATYALRGSFKRIGRAVFLCSPGGLPLEELETTQRAPRHLFDAMDERADSAHV